MQQVQPCGEFEFGEYVLFLKLINNLLFAGLSDGSIWSVEPKSKVVDQGLPLVGLCDLEGNVCFARTDGTVGVLNVQTSKISTWKAEYPLSSITTKKDLIACGTELQKPDAGVLIYKFGDKNPIREYMDSHSDDVTDVRFHPTEENVLISGSTDGTVNLYNLAIADPDETIYQSINHNSAIHRADFLSKERFFGLSQMEDLSIYQVAHPDESVAEPQPIEFGDLRSAWDCEYVADFLDGYFLIGSNNSEVLKFVPFIDQTPQLISAYNFVGAHGDDVVRCFVIDDNNRVYTGGEDGKIRAWQLPTDAIPEPKESSSKEVKRARKHKNKKKGHNPY